MKVLWISNPEMATGKGATVQQFVATVGDDKFEMNVSPWDEGDLRKNGIEVARITGRKNRRQVFLDLKSAAERHIRQSKPIIATR